MKLEVDKTEATDLLRAVETAAKEHNTFLNLAIRDNLKAGILFHTEILVSLCGIESKLEELLK